MLQRRQGRQQIKKYYCLETNPLLLRNMKCAAGFASRPCCRSCAGRCSGTPQNRSLMNNGVLIYRWYWVHSKDIHAASSGVSRKMKMGFQSNRPKGTVLSTANDLRSAGNSSRRSDGNRTAVRNQRLSKADRKSSLNAKVKRAMM